MAKNAFQRLVNKASVADEGYEDEYYDDYEDVGYFDENEEPEVTPIRSVAAGGDIARIITVWPKSIDGGQEFADPYRKGIPVILNMTAAPDGERRRILDFAMGVCYGLRGKVNKISNDVFLMTPHQVTVEASHPEESSDF
ncbi:MAG: cell division protein SepF [Ancrocorticia sp.]|uniref:cell division protein SepF n=1 Tax=Ancrocorticia sp. TaxID=2593684 RepID=UPI003F8E4DFE